MKLTYLARPPEGDTLGCLMLLIPETELTPPAQLAPELGALLERAAALREFEGKSGQTCLLLTPDPKVPRLLLVGLGKPEKVDREALRRAVGKGAQSLNAANVSTAGLWLPQGLPEAVAPHAAEAAAEGLLLGGYLFKNYKEQPKDKTPPKDELGAVTVYDPGAVSSAEGLERGIVRGEAVCLARDLGNHPGNAMTPTQLAEEARSLAQRHKLKLRILEREEMEHLGMGMLCAVAKGSREAPKLIVLEYHPPTKSDRTLAFVGKGITFDSGGISLKPGAAMDEMKFDMCGAAAVLGAMEAIARLKPPVNVVGVVPACENLPDGRAVKPGDILKAYNGKHVEVLNTDAEGRLILGDAVAYTAKEFKPDAMVDLATLTGACVIALGHYATGAVSNNASFQQRVVDAGQASGDIVWPLPAFPEYGEGLKGKYGDLQNIAGRDGGAITGGLFLQNFVGDVPWVHLDIAGTAWGVKNVGHVPNEGATGVGVRLLTDLACNWTGLN